MEVRIFMMKYTHTNINSPDWERLAQFYIDVFECKLFHLNAIFMANGLKRHQVLKVGSIWGSYYRGLSEGGPTFEYLHIL